MEDEATQNGQVQTEDEPQAVAYPGVLVLRIPADTPGQEQVQVQEINGMDPLAVPTLLAVAAKIKNQQLGLGD